MAAALLAALLSRVDLGPPFFIVYRESKTGAGTALKRVYRIFGGRHETGFSATARMGDRYRH
jgi:hypothetical protein